MDVKFIKTKKANLGTVPVVDGQIIAVDDAAGVYYDMGSVRRPVGSVKISSTLDSIGSTDELIAVTDENSPAIYYWDSVENCYKVLANKDTDKFMSFVKDASKTKIYLTGTDASAGSMNLFYNDNVYMDLSKGTISAVSFSGKATSAIVADSANESNHSKTSDVSNVAKKIDIPNCGNEFTGTYFKDGVPRSCSHSIKCDVPENAKFTDTTYDVFSPASVNSSGREGLVPAPPAGSQNKYLKGDGTWGNDTVPVMSGCTSSTNGTSGSVPAPIKGDQLKVLTGNGTWQALGVGDGIELNNFTYSLRNTGVAPGVYGPESNQSDGITYVGDYIEVPQITVDRYGRVTSIKEIRCKLNSSSSSDPTPTKQVTFAKFNISDDNILSVEYEDLDTTLATFSVDSDYNLRAQYNYNPTPYTLERDGDHVYAISVTDTQNIVNLGRVAVAGESDD